MDKTRIYRHVYICQPEQLPVLAEQNFSSEVLNALQLTPFKSSGQFFQTARRLILYTFKKSAVIDNKSSLTIKMAQMGPVIISISQPVLLFFKSFTWQFEL